MDKLILSSELDLGRHSSSSAIPFSITGVSKYNQSIKIDVRATCGCTTVKSVEVKPNSKFNITGTISKREVSGVKTIRIVSPEKHTVKLKYVIT